MSAMARFAASLLAEASQQDDEPATAPPTNTDVSSATTPKPESTPSNNGGTETRAEVVSLAYVSIECIHAHTSSVRLSLASHELSGIFTASQHEQLSVSAHVCVSPQVRRRHRKEWMEVEAECKKITSAAKKKNKIARELAEDQTAKIVST